MRDIDQNFYGDDGAWLGFTEWASCYEPTAGPVRIALTDERDTLGWWVSTVRLALPSRRRRDAMEYETLVFGGPLDQYRVHYATAPQAIAGHDQVVAEVRSRCLLDA